MLYTETPSGNIEAVAKPVRVQRKRTKGWKMPENTVSVTRPGKWGNPFKLGNDKPEDVVKKFRDLMMDLNSHEVEQRIYDKFKLMRDTIKDLKGKNLACFCKVGEPCHADVLLELANS